MASNLRVSITKALGPLLFMGCLGVLCFWIFYGFFDADSGYYYLQSALMAGGKKPYLDYSDIYPPLYSLINAIPVSMGINRWLIAWTTPLLWVLVTGCLTRYLISKAHITMRQVVPWIVGCCYVLFCVDYGGNHNTLEHGVVFFGLASLVVFTVSEWSAAVRFCAAGFLVSCALLSKQVGILFALPFLTQIKKRSELCFFLGGFLAPVLALLVWIRFDINGLVTSHKLLQTYLGEGPEQHIMGRIRSLVLLVVDDIIDRPYRLIPYLYLPYVGGITLASLWKKRDWRRLWWLASWCLIGCMFYGARTQNNFLHYTLNCWPAICVIIIESWTTIAGHVSAFHVRLTKWHGVGAAVRRVGVYLMVVAGLVIFAFGLSHQDAISRKCDDMLGALSRRNKLNGFCLPLSKDIAALVPKGAGVSHVGAERLLFFLSNRLPLNYSWAVGLPSPDLLFAGDGILVTDQRYLTATVAEVIDGHGYRVLKQWHTVWGNVVLYWRR